jgi:hypothetical protein
VTNASLRRLCNSTAAILRLDDSATDAEGAPVEAWVPVGGYEAVRCLVTDMPPEDLAAAGFERSMNVLKLGFPDPVPVAAGGLVDYINPDTGAEERLRALGDCRNANHHSRWWVVYARRFAG